MTFSRKILSFSRSLTLSPKVNNHETTNEYNGVHHVLELESPLSQGSRIVFMHGEAETVIFGDQSGHIHVCELKRPFSKKKLKIGPHSITDFDLSDSNELLVAAGDSKIHVAENFVNYNTVIIFQVMMEL